MILSFAKYALPVPKGSYYISDTFSEHVARHSVNPGTDFAVPYGTPVYAIESGRIAVADPYPDEAGGRTIALNGYSGLGYDYLHLSSLKVAAGNKVTKGQLIGYSGASAKGMNWGTGTHLHVSVRRTHAGHYFGAGNFNLMTLYAAPALPSANSGILWDQKQLNKWASYDGALPLVLDGVPGPKYVARVKLFQGLHGLTKDGIAGAKTDAKLAAPLPIVKSGSTGAHAKRAQVALNRHGYKLVVDGKFGTRSVNAAKAFQKVHSLTADGVIGSKTWAKL